MTSADDRSVVVAKRGFGRAGASARLVPLGAVFRFIVRSGVVRAGLSDVMEYWTLREYVELALLRAAYN